MSHTDEYQRFVLKAQEAVEFKLIRTKDDLSNGSIGFHPEMAHQIFGENESIFGYQGLKVQLLYIASSLQIYLAIKYTRSVKELSQPNIKPDDVVSTIAQTLPDGCYFVNMDEFLKVLEKAEKFKPYGEKIAEHTYRAQCETENGSHTERTFEIYYCNYKVPAFLKFFSRLQTFILWFVDAASYIDIDDPQWNYLVCYEKYKNSTGDYQYATAGYTTVYDYYAYPEHRRPRISQMLVLPPFQRMGIGTKFFESLYTFYQSQSNVIDITCEDPSEDFQRLRNVIDARLCKELPSFSRVAIKQPFNKDMIQEAREKFKINPRQCRKVYEILRLYYTNLHDEEDYKSYRLTIKRRLNAVYYKQFCDIEKLEKSKVDTQWFRARMPNPTDRLQQLNDEYQAVESEYKKVICKL